MSVDRERSGSGGLRALVSQYFESLPSTPAGAERQPLLTVAGSSYDSPVPSPVRGSLDLPANAVPSSAPNTLRKITPTMAPSSLVFTTLSQSKLQPEEPHVTIDAHPEGLAHTPEHAKTLGLLQFVFLGYFCVCGGPYGLEDAVGAGYPVATLACLLIVPWIWSLPLGLMVAELGTAMPDNDGYVLWIKKAYGPFLSFLAGFIAWMNAVVDIALYPVLFMSYLTQALQHFNFAHSHVYLYLIQLAVVVAVMALNMTGVDIVSKVSFLFAIVVVSPFVIMFVWSMESGHVHPHDWVKFPPNWSSWPICLNVVIWSYSGFDSVGLMAEELKNPKRNFPLAMILIILLSMATYLVALVGAVGLDTNYSHWSAGYFPELANTLGGSWFKLFMIVGGMISSFGLFNALLLTASNELRAFGRGDLLGVRALVWRHPTFKTPWLAIFCNVVLISIFSFLPFDSLVQLNNVLYCLLLLMIYASLIRLRYTHKDMARPFRISKSNIPTILLCVPPILLSVYIIVEACISNWQRLVIGSGLVIFGVGLYWGLFWVRRRKLPIPSKLIQ